MTTLRAGIGALLTAAVMGVNYSCAPPPKAMPTVWCPTRCSLQQNQRKAGHEAPPCTEGSTEQVKPAVSGHLAINAYAKLHEIYLRLGASTVKTEHFTDIQWTLYSRLSNRYAREKGVFASRKIKHMSTAAQRCTASLSALLLSYDATPIIKLRHGTATDPPRAQACRRLLSPRCR